jgi:hypothetical protein
LALKPGESAAHIHRTIHLQGGEAAVRALGQALLGAIE